MLHPQKEGHNQKVKFFLAVTFFFFSFLSNKNFNPAPIVLIMFGCVHFCKHNLRQCCLLPAAVLNIQYAGRFFIMWCIIFTHHISYVWALVNLLDELAHVLTQCFTARPLTLSVAIEWMGAGMLLVTVGRHRLFFFFFNCSYVYKTYSK